MSKALKRITRVTAKWCPIAGQTEQLQRTTAREDGDSHIASRYEQTRRDPMEKLSPNLDRAVRGETSAGLSGEHRTGDECDDDRDVRQPAGQREDDAGDGDDQQRRHQESDDPVDVVGSANRVRWLDLLRDHRALAESDHVRPFCDCGHIITPP